MTNTCDNGYVCSKGTIEKYFRISLQTLVDEGMFLI